METILNKGQNRAVSFILCLALIFGLTLMPDTVYGAVTDDLFAQNISITNNTNIPDVVQVTQLRPGDTIRVYTSTGALDTPAVTFTVRAGLSYARFELPGGTLDPNGGDIYLTNQASGEDESILRTQATYNREPTSIPPVPSNILVNNEDNYTNLLDRVYVMGLRNGDIVNVYDTRNTSITTPIGRSGAVPPTGRVEIFINDGLSNGTGSVWVTTTNVGRAESERVEAKYSASEETTTTAITASAINNYGVNDYILISNLYSGDIVEVYDTHDDYLYGKATVPTRSTDIQIKAKARKDDSKNAFFEGGGTFYIKITTPGKTTCKITAVAYTKEKQSSPITADDVQLINNAFVLDIATVSGLYPGDKVEVHQDIKDLDNVSLIKASTVPNKKNETRFTLKLPAVPGNASDGSVKIRVISVGMQPSEPFTVTYSATSASPDISTDPAFSDPILGQVENNANIPDTITFKNLMADDEIKIFTKAIGDDRCLATGKVTRGKTEITLSLSLPNDNLKTVYGQLRRAPLNPSATRVSIQYGVETTSTTAGITASAFNNAGASDLLTVENVPLNTVIKVFATPGETVKTIKGGTAKSKGPTINTDMSVTFPSNTGDVYVRFTETGKIQSDAILVSYGIEETSAIDPAVTGTAINILGTGDTITITRLKPLAVVKLYESISSVKVLATSKAKVNEAILKTKLEPDGGTIYFSVTDPNLKESTRTPLVYNPEDISEAFTSSSGIIIDNNVNTGTISDYVRVSASAIQTITRSSIIRIYRGQNDTTSIGSGTFNSTNDIEIKLSGRNVITPSTGAIWITHQEPKKRESSKYDVNYSGTINITSTTSALAINNDLTGKDYILVYGLKAGDIVTLNYMLKGVLKSQSLTVPVTQSQVAFSVTLEDSTWTTLPTDPKQHDNLTITRPGSEASLPIYIHNIQTTP